MRDDVEGEGNRLSIGRLDAELTSASASTEDRPMVEERSKTVVSTYLCNNNKLSHSCHFASACRSC